MTDLDKDEFWKGPGRLYDSILELRQASEAQYKSIQEQRVLFADLYKVAELHHREIQAPEKRLDRSEVILQWVAEAERKRGKGGTL